MKGWRVTAANDSKTNTYSEKYLGQREFLVLG
jgi:hypothetical protein